MGFRVQGVPGLRSGIGCIHPIGLVEACNVINQGSLNRVAA